MMCNDKWGMGCQCAVRVCMAMAVAMGLDAKPMDEVLNQAACCKSIKG